MYKQIKHIEHKYDVSIDLSKAIKSKNYIRVDTKNSNNIVRVYILTNEDYKFPLVCSSLKDFKLDKAISSELKNYDGLFYDTYLDGYVFVDGSSNTYSIIVKK